MIVMVVSEMSLSTRQWIIVTVGGQQHAHADLIGIKRHLSMKS